GGHAGVLVAAARLPAPAHPDAARPDDRSARRRLSHHPVHHCRRFGRIARQGLAGRHADAPRVHSGTHHRLHFRSLFGRIRPHRQQHPAAALPGHHRPRIGHRRQRGDLFRTPAGRFHRPIVLHLCFRQYGHGERHFARGRRAAAIDQLRRHGAGDAVSRHRHPHEHSEASQTGTDLNTHPSIITTTALRPWIIGTLLLSLWGCGTTPVQQAEETAPTSPAPAPVSKGGGYYLDDGPGNDIPADLDSIPDAQPRDEPLHRFANRPYVALGTRYEPEPHRREFRQRGIASWYGRRFHGKPTASGEPYDMYAMTAAHRTLPLPSYVRVTNLSNGRSVIVRVNDRGPFMKNRLIDLSWTAAKKLGFIEQGHARVRVELVLPGEEPAPREDVASASVAPSATTTADASLPAPGALATNTGAPGTALAAAQATTAPAGAGPAEGGSSGDSPRGFAPVASDAA